MTSAEHGTNTSGAELANVSQHGLWVLVDGAEYYLAFDRFPWFRNATIGQLARIEMPQPNHLHWPEIDIDLTIDMIERPEAYPLVSRAELNDQS